MDDDQPHRFGERTRCQPGRWRLTKRQAELLEVLLAFRRDGERSATSQEIGERCVPPRSAQRASRDLADLQFKLPDTPLAWRLEQTTCGRRHVWVAVAAKSIRTQKTQYRGK